jgi:LysR family glycine cleavage system transcriptional activator
VPKNSVSLNAVRVFTVAAKAKSFKLAAEQLCVTAGAISRQIQTLEEQLGIKLFERHCREVRLSQVGQLYLSQVAPALSTIESASDQVRDLTQAPKVRIETTQTFAMHWLIPRLRLFRDLHPEIEVNLSTTSGLINYSREIDLYVRRDPEQFAGLKGDSFMAEQSLLVCSPEFLANNALREPRDVVKAPLIAMKSRADLWPAWLRHNEMEESPMAHTIGLDNTIFAIQAATEGLGVALIPRLFLADLIGGNALVVVPGFPALTSGSYQLLGYQPGKKSAVDIFAAWLKDLAQADVTL